MASKMKNVSVKDWNEMQRDLRRLEKFVIHLNEQAGLQEQRTDILYQTMIVPSGKVLGK